MTILGRTLFLLLLVVIIGLSLMIGFMLRGLRTSQVSDKMSKTEIIKFCQIVSSQTTNNGWKYASCLKAFSEIDKTKTLEIL